MLCLLTPLAILASSHLAAQNSNAPVENEYVRVLSVTDAPKAQPGAVHEHKDNRVMIYLDSGDIRLKYVNGEAQNQHWKPGDVAWSPASGMTRARICRTGEIRIIEIELRNPASAGQAAPPDRTHAIVDNSQVRVYESSKPPSGKADPAKDYVAVDLRNCRCGMENGCRSSGAICIRN